MLRFPVIPFEAIEGCHSSTVLPVDHVGCCVQKPVIHLESFSIAFIMRCVKKYGVVVQHRSRIGCEFCLNDGHI